jgi:outer membrane protein TolC
MHWVQTALFVAVIAVGCTTARAPSPLGDDGFSPYPSRVAHRSSTSSTPDGAKESSAQANSSAPPDREPEADTSEEDEPDIRLASEEQPEAESPPEAGPALPPGALIGDEPILPQLAGEPDEEIPADALALDDVIGSVYRTYPLLEAALFNRNIALGEHVAAQGNFDTQLLAASQNEPMGFYQNYRQSISVVQPVFSGGEFFTGYRLGRGLFAPWYKGRDTNEGGEFAGGFRMPLSRDRAIDARRAAFFRTEFGRHLAEADIQAQLISFVQEASHAYWDWVAAGQSYAIAERILFFAEERTDGIRRQVELQVLAPPVLVDNLRLVAERKAALADARRRVEQTAARLSLFFRDEQGRPVIPSMDQQPRFPGPAMIDPDALDRDLVQAVQQRPELRVLDITRQQLDVDLAQARNEFLPGLDAAVMASQDVGAPTTPTRDKSEFELEASIFFDVPIQRRQARGRITATDGRIGQLLATRRQIEDQVVVDVRMAYAALIAAYEEAVQARIAVDHAERLAEVERRQFALDISELLTVALREQFAAETAEQEVQALRRFFQAEADYRAAIALDRLP